MSFDAPNRTPDNIDYTLLKNAIKKNTEAANQLRAKVSDFVSKKNDSIVASSLINHVVNLEMARSKVLSEIAKDTSQGKRNESLETAAAELSSCLEHMHEAFSTVEKQSAPDAESAEA